MLIACSECHRQIDVGDHAAGTLVRCFCGARTAVPEPRARQVPMQHCSNCGGALTEDGAACEFCDAKLTIAERGWGDSCPGCFARMVRGAKFCGACGLEIRPQGALRPAGQVCPRCDRELTLCEHGEDALIECIGCGGVWLTESAFGELVSGAHERSIADSLPIAPEPAPLPPLERHPVRYLKCPECREPMNRKNFGEVSGVMIDVCRRHGLWFDLHELEHIRRFVAEGGLERMRKRRAERLEWNERRNQKTVRRIRTQRSRSGWDADTLASFWLIDILVDFAGDVLGSLWD